MYAFEPTSGIKETARNARRFVDHHSVVVWDILTPIIAMVFGVYLVDVILAEFLLDKPKGVVLQKDAFGNYRAIKQTKQMGVGLNILGLYLYFVFMISWMRVCLKGAGQSVMSPIKPKKAELKLLGVLLLVGVAMGIALVTGSYIVAQAGKLAVLIYLCFGAGFIFYACVRLNFYFAAMTVGDKITLSQAYALGDGYVWKIIASGLMANIKLILMLLGYVFLVTLCMHFAGKNIFNAHVISYLNFALITLPVALYFTPMMYAHSTAVVANYYRYATQNVAIPSVGHDRGPREKMDPEQKARARERKEIQDETPF